MGKLAVYPAKSKPFFVNRSGLSDRLKLVIEPTIF